MSQSSPNPEKLENILQTLDIICACFPMSQHAPGDHQRWAAPTTAVGKCSAAAEALRHSCRKAGIAGGPPSRQMQRGEVGLLWQLQLQSALTEGPGS